MLISLNDIQARISCKDYNSYMPLLVNCPYVEDLHHLYSKVSENGFAIFAVNARYNLLEIIRYMRLNFGRNIRDSGIGRKYLSKVSYVPNKKFYFNSSIAQPLHTDEGYRNTFPRFTSLYCISSDLNGGISVLVDGKKLIAYLNDEFSEFFPLAFEYDFMQLETAIGGIKKPLLFHLPDKSIGITYSPILKEISSSYEGMKLISAVNEYIHNPTNQVRIKLKPGELLVMDNCKVLHGRTEFNPNSNRLFLRLWNGEMSL